MQIVIELTDEMYANVQAEVERSIHPSRDARWTRLLLAICNGEVLPKGHGDLKDASKMIADLNTVRVDNYAETIEWTCNVIDSYPTIIEADKEVDE